MDNLIVIAPYIFGIITTSVAYILGTSKRKSEIKKNDQESQHTHLENVESALEIYRTMLDRLKINLEEAEEAYEKAIVEVATLKDQNRTLKINNKELMRALRTCDFETCKTLNPLKDEKD